MSAEQSARTPLYENHVALGARMAPFAGYTMPIVYAGIAGEHSAVRNSCGAFDVSHMGRLRFQGVSGKNALQRLTTIHVPAVQPGCARYGLILNDDSGIIDDVFLYVPFEGEYLLVVNAANRQAVLARLEELSLKDDVVDETGTTAMIAVQGPDARPAVSSVIPGVEIPALSNRIATFLRDGAMHSIATTGYTGEDGVEIIGPNGSIAALWEQLIDEGATPAGLGARDTLRLEVAYPLHGHELTPRTHPKQGRVSWAVDARNEVFAGRDAYLSGIESSHPKLVGIEVSSRGVPRAEQAVHCDGNPVGHTTSGTFSPTLRKGIALAYVTSPDCAALGTVLEIIPEGSSARALSGTVVRTPFYREGSRRSSEE